MTTADPLIPGLQGTFPGLTPSPINVTPFLPGVPLDILSTAMRRVEELSPYLVKKGLPVTLHDILRDAVVAAYQRGQTEQRAEADLLIESMDKINKRRSERLTELVVAQCMDALCATEMSVDLSRSLNGNLTMRLQEGTRHVVHYTYTENGDER